jgi:hypothetical protein
MRAHEGVPRLIPEPDEVNPGGVLTVRVEDLTPEGTIELTLANEAGSVSLATVAIDPEGHAIVFLEVPVDMPRGEYLLDATAVGVDVPPVAVLVSGPAVVEGGEPGAMEEGDGLLVALPPDWQQSLSGPIVTARPLTETLPAGSGARQTVESLVAILAVLIGVTAIAYVVLSRTRAARRRGATGP